MEDPSFENCNEPTSTCSGPRRFYLNHSVSIVGVVLVSFSYDYLKTRIETEKTILGRMLSYALCSRYKSLLRNNVMVEQLIPEEILGALENCVLVSEYDSIMYTYLGYEREEHLHTCYSATNLSDCYIPLLAVQPFDDFIYGGNVEKQIDIDILIQNESFIYWGTSHGSHLGFIERCADGSCYTYPVRVACEFFKSLVLDK